eukprot:7065979-Pyramimonas_sp.AAC.1
MVKGCIVVRTPNTLTCRYLYPFVALPRYVCTLSQVPPGASLCHAMPQDVSLASYVSRVCDADWSSV